MVSGGCHARVGGPARRCAAFKGCCSSFNHRMVCPKATADQVSAMTHQQTGQRHSRADLTRREQQLGLTRKVGSTLAFQALTPANLHKRHLFWNTGPHTGVVGHDRHDVIDIDEAGAVACDMCAPLLRPHCLGGAGLSAGQHHQAAAAVATARQAPRPAPHRAMAWRHAPSTQRHSTPRPTAPRHGAMRRARHATARHATAHHATARHATARHATTQSRQCPPPPPPSTHRRPGLFLEQANPKRGKSRRGVSFRQPGPHGRSHKWTLICAMKTNGMKVWTFHKVAGTGTDTFVAFVGKVLASPLVPAGGPRQTFLWDNLNSHKSGAVTNAVYGAGHRVLNRPPCRPQDGPIEHTFNQLEQEVRPAPCPPPFCACRLPLPPPPPPPNVFLG